VETEVPKASEEDPAAFFGLCARHLSAILWTTFNLEESVGRTVRGQTRSEILKFMRARIVAGESPTVREVQQAFGFRAVESARAHLKRLVAAGELQHLPGLARGYRLPEALGTTTLVPLLGQVQAGALTDAIEDPEGYLPVQSSGAGEDLFALRIEGQSMSGVGILPGDLVVVRQQATAREGDVVVALVGDEATVKTLRFQGQQVVLQPENSAFEPILPEPGAVQILGKVVEVRRYLEPTLRGVRVLP
jgi:repressor LexA